MQITLFIGGLNAGGAERVICGLANHLAYRHTVSLLTMSGHQAAYRLDGRVTRISLDNSISNRILKNIGRVAALVNYVKKHRKNTYVAFLPVTSYLILSLRPLIKGRVFFSVRNDPSKEFAGAFNAFLCKWLFPKADGIVFQTSEEKEYFSGVKIKDYRIIANPISEEFLRDAPIDPDQKETRIVSVGRLAPQKNFGLLIRAFAEIADQYQNYSLVIFGEGGERDQLEQLIKENDLAGRCFLPGKTERVRDELKKSELFISSSDYEGISNALLEAMAVGLPVISTDWSGGGARTLIEDGVNGLLVPVGDREALAEAIERLLSDPARREELADHAKDTKIRFSPRTIFKEWEDYLNELS